MKNETQLELATRLITLLQAEGLLAGNDSGPGMYVGRTLRLGLEFRFSLGRTNTSWGVTYARRVLAPRRQGVLDQLAAHIAKQLSAVELERRLQQVTDELPKPPVNSPAKATKSLDRYVIYGGTKIIGQ